MVARINCLRKILAIQPTKQGTELSVEDGDELRVTWRKKVDFGEKERWVWV